MLYSSRSTLSCTVHASLLSLLCSFTKIPATRGSPEMVLFSTMNALCMSPVSCTFDEKHESQTTEYDSLQLVVTLDYVQIV